ncbi:neuroligin-4, X-linked-like [Centruroides sculpturatus]|uniref:neuroligin-4, X-linked-like n=1 Tax=Centruroides sculpturatus TaxID=218467 RepID=UPI000C6DB958|nr:neuroligin-4, X-linked-like [Centruroides sculpturatus]
MVYIHGESYEWNSGNPYDGSVLASYGLVVVVTINYRLGVLGFLPSLDNSARGNYGLMDQVAALHWIQENIGGFGGDPRNVTVFGHDYGAACTNFLMISPMARGLFNRAILQSGSALSSWAIANDAISYTHHLANRLACPTKNNVLLVECMRQRPLSDIIRAQPKPPIHGPVFGPTVDGIVIPSSPSLLMDNSTDLYGHYDMLFGITRTEFYHDFSAEEEKSGIDRDRRDSFILSLLRTLYSSRLQEIFLITVSEYTDWTRPTQHPVNMMESTADILGDALFVAPIVRAGMFHSTVRSQSYLYVFTYQTESGEFSQRLGCIHGEELPYVFGVPLVGTLAHFSGNYTRSEISLAEAVMTFWTNFVKTG